MPSPAPEELAARWAARHPGHETGHGVLAGWLRLMWRAARPLAAAGVSPDAVTLGGAALAVAATRAPRGAASALLLAAALADGLDGAVAVLRDVASEHGRALDHAADRVGDGAAAVTLVRAGAPAALVAGALGAGVVQEAVRGRLVPVVTVHERPTRVVCAMLGDLVGAATRRRWPAVVAAVVWDVLAVIGLGQLAWAQRRRQVSRPSP